MKKKKTVKIVILSVLALLLVLIVFLGVRYRGIVKIALNFENIKAFVTSQLSDRESLEKQMEENKKKMEKLAEEDPNINIRGDLTEEEAEALREGKITYEEAVAIVKGDTTLDKMLKAEDPPPSDKDPPKQKESGEPKEEDLKDTPPEKKEPVSTAPKDRASEIIAELFVLQAAFISKLENVGDRAYADYKATHYDRSKVMDIVNGYTGEVGVLETECDTKVRALLSELEAELTKVGGDLGVVKEIRKHYYEEKRLKKAYYMDRLDDEDYK